jgi:hypothetical protein
MEARMENSRNWLSWLLEMIPVRGTLDYRCVFHENDGTGDRLDMPWR